MSDIKLGQLIQPGEVYKEKDAVHLPIAVVVASEKMKPGQRISILEGSAYPEENGNAVAIVDALLEKPVKVGDKFRAYMLPNQIQNLRHEWDHPSFPEPEPEVVYRDREYEEDDGCRVVGRDLRSANTNQ